MSTLLTETITNMFKPQTVTPKYSCNDCGKHFRKPSLLLRHEAVHTTTKNFVCADCNKCFTQKASLQRHYSHSHKGERKHKCPKCEMNFAQKINLQTHLQRTHLLKSCYNDNNISFACSECSCIFSKLNTLNRHKAQHRAAEQFAQKQLISNLHNDAPVIDAASLAKNVLEQLKELNSGMQQQHEKLESKSVEIYHANYEAVEKTSRLLETTIVDEAAAEVVILSDKLNMIGEVHLVSAQRITRASSLAYYVCEFCAKEFRKKYDFLRHRRIHTNEFFYKCDYCESSFTTNAKRNEHSQIHILDEKMGIIKKQHLCVICGKNFKSMRQLDMHMRTHSNSHTVQYNCSYCHATYATKTAFSAHKHKVDDKELKMLNKFLPDPINLTSTEKQLVDDDSKQKAYENRRFECFVCRLKLKNHTHLKQHEMHKHNGSRSFICACGRNFISKSAVNVHGKIHSTLTNYFVCQVCPQTKFATRAQLQRHSLVFHTKTKNFKCPYCTQTFKTTQYCRSHMKTHLKRLLSERAGTSSENVIISKQSKEVTKHACNFCCKTFRKYDLQRHLRTHIQTSLNCRRPFACDMCGKSFALKSTLSYHLSTHAVSRITHECQVCGKRYAAKKVLNIHLRLHTGKCHLFQCNFCERSFRTSGHRISHTKAAHAKET